MPFDFLSDEWVAEARKIRAEFKDLSSPDLEPDAHQPRRDRGPRARARWTHTSTRPRASPTSSADISTAPTSP